MAYAVQGQHHPLSHAEKILEELFLSKVLTPIVESRNSSSNTLTFRVFGR